MNTQKTLGSVEITKEYFVKIIDQLEKQNLYDISYCRKLGEILHPHIEPYDNQLIIGSLIKIIQQAFNDDHIDSWIEYFCWELEFGKRYEDGFATNQDGSKIDLSDSGKLYDFLVEKETPTEAPIKEPEEEWEDIDCDIDFSKLEAISCSNSLHIIEEIHEVNGEKYKVYYAIGGSGKAPFVQKLKK